MLMTNPPAVEGKKPVLKPWEWKYAPTFEGVFVQTQMLLNAMTSHGVGSSLGDEAVTPWGVPLSDFENVAKSLGDSFGDLDARKDYVARYCGYTNYAHMVSLSEEFSQFWQLRYAQKIKSEFRTLVIDSRGLLQGFIDCLQVSLGEISETEARLGRDVSALHPYEGSLELDCSISGYRDLGVETVEVFTGQEGTVGSYLQLGKDDFTNPRWLKESFKSFEFLAGDLDSYGHYNCSQAYALTQCAKLLDCHIEEEKRLFEATLHLDGSTQLIAVMPAFLDELVVVFEYSKALQKGTAVKVKREDWENCQSEMKADSTPYASTHGVLKHIRALTDKSNTVWDTHHGWAQRTR